MGRLAPDPENEDLSAASFSGAWPRDSSTEASIFVGVVLGQTPVDLQ